MKKILLFIVLIISLVTCAKADIEEDIFLQLVQIYDGEIYYLEQVNSTYKKLIKNGSKPLNPYSFMDMIGFSQETAWNVRFINYFDMYGIKGDSPNYYYEKIYIPLKEYCATDEATCFFIDLFLYNIDSAEEKLAECKKAIKGLNDGLNAKELQVLYKAVFKLVEYVHNDMEYSKLSIKIDEFKDERRQIKSDFEFIYDWPNLDINSLGYSYSEGLNELLHEPEKAELIEKYNLAVELKKDGYLLEAIDLFNELGNYEDSISFVEECEKNLSRLKEFSSTTILQSSTERYEEKYEYNADGSCTIIEKNYVNNDDLKRTTTIKVNANGQFISGVTKGAFAQVDRKSYSESTDTFTDTYKYNDHNDIVLSKIAYDPIYMQSKNATYTYEYEYDDHDNKTQMTVKHNGETLYIARYEYQYDNDGNMIRMEIDGPTSTPISEYNYNEYGYLICQKTFSESGELRSTKSYRYKIPFIE